MVDAPCAWTWTTKPLNPAGIPRAVITSSLWAFPPSLDADRPPSKRLDRLGSFGRLSIGRGDVYDPDPPMSECVEVDVRAKLEDPDPPKELARTAVVITPHRSMGRFLLHHYAGSYTDRWRFDRLAVRHDTRVDVLSPDETMLVEPRRWYELRFGAIYGFVADDVARAYLDAHAHTELYLWLDDPDMVPPPQVKSRTEDPDATEFDPPEPTIPSPVRSSTEARVIAHAYGHLLAGYPWVLTAEPLATHLVGSGIDAVPIDREGLTKVVKNVMGRLKYQLFGDRSGWPTPGEVEAGLMLLREHILTLQDRQAVVWIGDGDTSLTQHYEPIAQCHRALQQPSPVDWDQ